MNTAAATSSCAAAAAEMFIFCRRNTAGFRTAVVCEFGRKRVIAASRDSALDVKSTQPSTYLVCVYNTYYSSMITIAEMVYIVYQVEYRSTYSST